MSKQTNDRDESAARAGSQTNQGQQGGQGGRKQDEQTGSRQNQEEYLTKVEVTTRAARSRARPDLRANRTGRATKGTRGTNPRIRTKICAMRKAIGARGTCNRVAAAKGFRHSFLW